MYDIQELRDQMTAMKKNLDKYAIVNEKLIHTVMSKRSQGLNWFVNAEIILFPFICFFFFGICAVLELSIWIAITIAVGCALSTLADMKTMRVSQKRINKSSLYELRTFLIRQKRNRIIQSAIELPLCAAWLIWFMLEYLDNDNLFGDLKSSDTFIYVKVILIAAMLLLFVIIVAIIFRKIQKVNDAMLSDIDLLEKTEKEGDIQ